MIVHKICLQLKLIKDKLTKVVSTLHYGRRSKPQAPGVSLYLCRYIRPMVWKNIVLQTNGMILTIIKSNVFGCQQRSRPNFL